MRSRTPARAVIAVAAALLLLAGCTSGEAPGEPSSPPSPSVPATSAAPESQTPEPAEEVRFAYQPPDSPCPPVSALATLPLPDGDPYVLTDPFFSTTGSAIC